MSVVASTPPTVPAVPTVPTPPASPDRPRALNTLARPQGRFLTGHLADVGADRLGFLTRCAREYGNFVPLRLAFTPTLLVNDPAAVEEVLVHQHRNFVKTPALKVASRVLGQGLLTSEGEFWRRQRQLIQPAFHRRRIAAYGLTMVAEAERLLATWRDGETRDVAFDMTGLTMAIATKTLFGADAGTDIAARLSPVLKEIGEYLNSRMYSLLFLLPDSVPTPATLRYRHAVRALDAVICEMIGHARREAEQLDGGWQTENGGREQDESAIRRPPSIPLLPMLLAAQDADDGRRMAPEQLRDEVMTLFLAGHDTTALTLTWTAYLLSQHPQAALRLREELHESLDGRSPTAEDLPKLRYCAMVIAESMRLYPPAWVMGRQAIRDCVIGGYRVPKGTVVLVSQWTMHRDPRFYDDPEAFRPERWQDGLAKRLPKYAYFPFGGGPRVCIGNAFATMEARLVLATMAQRFCLDLAPGHPVETETYLTLRPKYGMRMVVKAT